MACIVRYSMDWLYNSYLPCIPTTHNTLSIDISFQYALFDLQDNLGDTTESPISVPHYRMHHAYSCHTPTQTLAALSNTCMASDSFRFDKATHLRAFYSESTPLPIASTHLPASHSSIPLVLCPQSTHASLYTTSLTPLKCGCSAQNAFWKRLLLRIFSAIDAFPFDCA